jgi:hypothetical protein
VAVTSIDQWSKYLIELIVTAFVSVREEENPAPTIGFGHKAVKVSFGSPAGHTRKSQTPSSPPHSCTPRRGSSSWGPSVTDHARDVGGLGPPLVAT